MMKGRLPVHGRAVARGQLVALAQQRRRARRHRRARAVAQRGRRLLPLADGHLVVPLRTPARRRLRRHIVVRRHTLQTRRPRLMPRLLLLLLFILLTLLLLLLIPLILSELRLLYVFEPPALPRRCRRRIMRENVIVRPSAARRRRDRYGLVIDERADRVRLLRAIEIVRDVPADRARLTLDLARLRSREFFRTNIGILH